MEELFISILPDENKRKELLSACRMIAAQSLKEAGCIESRLFQDINEDGIKIEQKWLRQKLLMDYFRSDHFTALIGAMKWLGRSYQIRIGDSTPEEGLAVVNHARKTIKTTSSI